MNTKSNLVDKIMDYEMGMMDDESIIAFFQELIDTRTVYSLQGSYQRTAQALINEGYCTAS